MSNNSTSTSSDEQYEDLEDSHSSEAEKDSSGGAFGGFDSSTRLHYRVETDQEGRSEIISDIASGSQTEDLLNRSINAAEETWRDLEAVADRLGELSPITTEENSELELALFPRTG